MERNSSTLSLVALCVGVLGLGVAVASWVHFGARLDQIHREQKAQSNNVVTLKDDVATLESRVSDMENDGEVALSEKYLPPGSTPSRSPEEIRKLREELDAMRESGLETEEGEQAVLDILARHRTEVAEKLFQKKQDWTHRNLDKFYEQFEVEDEKATKATEAYDALMQTWHELGMSFVERDKGPKQLKSEFIEANRVFRDQAYEILGEELGQKFVRTVAPNRQFRRKVFGVR